MTTETKYKLDDIAFTLYESKIYEGIITGISIIKSNNLCSWNNKIEYCINILPVKQEHIVFEKDLFKTKEELINSL